MKKFSNLFSGINPFRLVLTLLSGCACVIAAGVVCSKNPSPAGWITAAVICAALITASEIMGKTLSRTGMEMSGSELSSVTLDYLVKTPTPIMICRESTVYWVNEAFIASTGLKDPSGKSFSSVTGTDILKIQKFSGKTGTEITIGENSFRVRYGSFSSKTRQYDILLFENVTELNSLNTKLNDEEPFVAYIMADSLEELSRYSGESMRETAVSLDRLLNEFAEENNCIVKEFGNNRYLMLVSGKDLDGMIENRFDLLDRVREISAGESSIPVTVSIGICHTHGTLNEKERIAKDALDMALQRGGDQAVVKTEKGLEFFGGKSQSVQKRTKVRARIISNELVSQILSSSDVLIMGHRNPDFDAIGASVAIGSLCAYLKKGFRIVLNTENESFARYLPTLKGIEWCPMSVFLPYGEAAEKLKADTLLVNVDFNNREQAECPDLIDMAAKTVYIDHHRKTAEFNTQPLISYIEPAASSASELVSEILEQILPSGTLTPEEALLLYSGILLDTKQFRKNTGARTFSAAVYLRNCGASPDEAQQLFSESFEDKIAQAVMESGTTLYRGVFAITKSDIVNDRVTAAKAADSLLSASGVLASFALCQIDGGIHISCRSNGKINVQLIAEDLGGGGHFDSAATVLQCDGNEAVSRLKKAIDAYVSNAVNNEKTK